MKTMFARALVFGLLASTPCFPAPHGMTEAEEVIAKFQITELMYRYALIHNTDDPEGYAGLFTEDGEMGPFKGHAAILAMARGEVDKLSKHMTSVEGEYHFGFMRTLIINPVVDIIDKTHAKGVSYLQVVVPNVDNNDIPTILFMGTYQDEYRKVKGKWLISKRLSFGKMNYPGLGGKLGLGPAPAKKEN